MVTIDAEEVLRELGNKIENKAIQTHEGDRKLKSKYQTPDEFWCDWYEKGYRRALADLIALLSKKEKEQLIK